MSVLPRLIVCCQEITKWNSLNWFKMTHRWCNFCLGFKIFTLIMTTLTSSPDFCIWPAENAAQASNWRCYTQLPTGDPISASILNNWHLYLLCTLADSISSPLGNWKSQDAGKADTVSKQGYNLSQLDKDLLFIIFGVADNYTVILIYKMRIYAPVYMVYIPEYGRTIVGKVGFLNMLSSI